MAPFRRGDPGYMIEPDAPTVNDSAGNPITPHGNVARA